METRLTTPDRACRRACLIRPVLSSGHVWRSLLLEMGERGINVSLRKRPAVMIAVIIETSWRFKSKVEMKSRARRGDCFISAANCRWRRMICRGIKKPADGSGFDSIKVINKDGWR